MFTFKNQETPRGLASIGAADTFDIKIKKKICGYCTNGGWFNREGDYTISFRVVDTAFTLNWVWATLAKKFKTKEEAKEWLKTNYKALVEKYEFYFMED